MAGARPGLGRAGLTERSGSRALACTSRRRSSAGAIRQRGRRRRSSGSCAGCGGGSRCRRPWNGRPGEGPTRATLTERSRDGQNGSVATTGAAAPDVLASRDGVSAACNGAGAAARARTSRHQSGWACGEHSRCSRSPHRGSEDAQARVVVERSRAFAQRPARPGRLDDAFAANHSALGNAETRARAPRCRHGVQEAHGRARPRRRRALGVAQHLRHARLSGVRSRPAALEGAADRDRLVSPRAGSRTGSAGSATATREGLAGEAIVAIQTMVRTVWAP